MCKTKKGCDVLECGQQNWGYGCYIVPHSCKDLEWDYADKNLCPPGEYDTKIPKEDKDYFCDENNQQYRGKKYCSILKKHCKNCS